MKRRQERDSGNNRNNGNEGCEIKKVYVRNGRILKYYPVFTSRSGDFLRLCKLVPSLLFSLAVVCDIRSVIIFSPPTLADMRQEWMEERRGNKTSTLTHVTPREGRCSKTPCFHFRSCSPLREIESERGRTRVCFDSAIEWVDTRECGSVGRF